MDISCCEHVLFCLTEEPTEILSLLGEQQRIVGLSAYTLRPPQARRTRPVVNAVLDGDVEKITALRPDLRPDLLIDISDIQAPLVSELIAAGPNVVIFNQRSLRQILGVLLTIGRQPRARRSVQ